jgi:hypothetical protein
MTPCPSEVWSFSSSSAPKGELKWKHHLCIGDDGLFLFVSTYRVREEDHRGVLVIPIDDVPFLPPTETRRSEISCTTIIARAFPDRTVSWRNPRGKVRRELMAELLVYVRTSPQLTEDERDAILDNLYDYYGTDLGRISTPAHQTAPPGARR